MYILLVCQTQNKHEFVDVWILDAEKERTIAWLLKVFKDEKRATNL
jgi:hypothetical protein